MFDSFSIHEISLFFSYLIATVGVLINKKNPFAVYVYYCCCLYGVLISQGVQNAWDHGAIHLLSGYFLFLSTKRIKVSLIIVWALLLSFFVMYLVLRFSGYTAVYHNYLLLGVLTVSSKLYGEYKDSVTRNVFFSTLLVSIFTLSKLGFLFAAISIAYVLYKNKRSVYLVIPLLVVLPFVVTLGLEFAGYSDFSEYLERRVFRDKYTGGHVQVFGISDGHRLSIWEHQFTEFLREEPLLGQGDQYKKFYDSRSRDVIYNHNFFLTQLCLYGAPVTFAMLFSLFRISRFVPVYPYLVLGFIVIGLVGEGFFVPFVFNLSCVFAGVMYSWSSSNLVLNETSFKPETGVRRVCPKPV